MSKQSIRFYHDHEVRAVWDEEHSKWWFSIVDITKAITESPNPRKYWSVLKSRLKKSNNELTTKCSQLKLSASDGKKYKTDCYAQEDILDIVKAFPSKKTDDFLDWFTYSENTIDGRSKKKAYTFIESNMVADKDIGTVKALQQIHAYIFGGLYDFAGKIRTKTISKGNTLFCLAEYLPQNLKVIEQMPENTFDEIVDKYVEMNVAHPFMEGNGRSHVVGTSFSGNDYQSVLRHLCDEIYDIYGIKKNNNHQEKLEEEAQHLVLELVNHH